MADNNQQPPLQEISMTIEEAGRHALKMVVPFLLVYGVPFFLFYGWDPLSVPALSGVLLFFLATVVGIPVHELIHALLFGLLSEQGFKSIRFGIDRKTLSPYCHPAGDIKVWVYRVGALGPLVLMGVLPAVAALVTGQVALLLFGLLYSIAAGGDILSVWLTRGLSPADTIRDHDSKLGFYIVYRNK